MASGFGETTSHNGDGDGASNFECNICLDLAQDPIVTLCGHLFCWPCLYKWLSFHSHSQQCPVCKAFVQVDKLVPLYGRGKSSSDPRSKSIPGIHIPDRPSGQRPETAPPPAPAPQTNHIHQHGFGVMGGWGGFAPVITARFANFPLSVAFGGVIPSFLNFQRHGFANAAMYGTNTGYHHQPYGYGNPYHGVHPRVHHRHPGHGQQDNYLMMLLLVIAVLVLLTLATT